jgi:hypothetical protein
LTKIKLLPNERTDDKPVERKETPMISRIILCASAAAMLLIPQVASADTSVKVGRLRCSISGGLGLIITSKKTLHCRFSSLHGYSENYDGVVRNFGLDIGATTKGLMAWDVLAPTEGPRAGALAGDYAGVSASATVAAGVGANVLVGGWNKSITLQPLSLQVQAGLALSAGVSSLTLTAE